MFEFLDQDLKKFMDSQPDGIDHMLIKVYDPPVHTSTTPFHPPPPPQMDQSLPILHCVRLGSIENAGSMRGVWIGVERG